MTPEQVIGMMDSNLVLALTLVGEARGEPIESIVGVGSVIRNRLHHSDKYKSYKEVCLAPKQFSCWNTDDTNYPYLIAWGEKLLAGEQPTDIYIRQCFWVAHGISEWALVDNTGGRMNYMSTKEFNSAARPEWAQNPKGTLIEFGNHTYFNV